MKIDQHRFWQLIGIAGTAGCLTAFFISPNFPTPDKLIIFLTFVFMIFNQASEMLKRFVPFVGLLLAYESFRSIADKLNSHVNYSFAPALDRHLFGNLPTVYLQRWLWHGQVHWYDFVLYVPYLLHFIIPVGLGILIWKTREKHYWRFVTTYLTVSFGAFITFLLFPAAPPWLASDNHYIPHIERISSDVWVHLGLHNFPSFYNHITPNPVAAIPSLHAAWATLFVIFIYKLFGKRWALLAAVYPSLIFIGTVYEAEHYVTDLIVGIIYAILAYLVSPYVLGYLIKWWRQLKHLPRLIKKAV